MESSLGTDLSRLVRMWRAVIDRRLKPLGLTQTLWVTLHNIHELPAGQSQIQLTKKIGIEQPSLVRSLDQLEQKGLIARTSCSDDRRAKRISLTEKAAPIIDRLQSVIRQSRHEVLEGLSAEELQQLISLIARLEKNITDLQNRSVRSNNRQPR